MQRNTGHPGDVARPLGRNPAGFAPANHRCVVQAELSTERLHSTCGCDDVTDVHTPKVGYSNISRQAESWKRPHTKATSAADLPPKARAQPMQEPPENSHQQDKNRSELGFRLRTLREQSKASQIEVAVAVNVDRTTISNIERGRDKPGRKVLMALAKHFDVSLDWLASGEGPIRPDDSRAKTEQEALLLAGFRRLPPAAAESLLQMILNINKPKSS